MILTLEVTQSQAGTPVDQSRRQFSTQGGTIGRASSCDWVLSHRQVSGRHASISSQDGVFYIVDEQSANGLFLNSSKNRLVPGRRYALKDGDRILIGPYELEVSITSGRADRERQPFDDAHNQGAAGYASAYDPFDAGDPFGPPTPRIPSADRPPPPTPRPTPAGEPVPLEQVDPLQLLPGKREKTPARQAPSAKDLHNASPLAEHYQPPSVPTPSPAPPVARPPVHFEIPADYDPLRDDFVEPAVEEPPVAPTPIPVLPAPAEIPLPPPQPVAERPTPVPVAPVPEPPPPSPGLDAALPGLQAVLAGAGLERAPVTLEFARNFGEIFRVVVSGVMDVLRARQEIKDEFRMRLTQFRPADNNPLKFSANVDDALHNLLVKRNPAYLQPVEAFSDAFDDLREHQMAMLAGVRKAFDTILAEFNPDNLQLEFDRQSQGGGLFGRKRYWELYRERLETMTKDPEAAFRRLFGEEFAKAYEEQLRLLRAQRRARDPGL